LQNEKIRGEDKNLGDILTKDRNGSIDIFMLPVYVDALASCFNDFVSIFFRLSHERSRRFFPGQSRQIIGDLGKSSLECEGPNRREEENNRNLCARKSSLSPDLRINCI
jgi:hypothetical protein